MAPKARGGAGPAPAIDARDVASQRVRALTVGLAALGIVAASTVGYAAAAERAHSAGASGGTSTGNSGTTDDQYQWSPPVVTNNPPRAASHGS